MTKEDKLTLLKQDLQMLTSSNDVFLSSLLDAAQAAIQREGIVIPENDIDIDLCIVQYAAYLFRKHFYSHAPRGARRDRNWGNVFRQAISTHTPLAGRDAIRIHM